MRSIDMRTIEIASADLLVYACMIGNLNAVKFLVEKGVNINGRGSRGWPPIVYAMGFEHIDIVKYLISKGADVNITTQQTPFDIPVGLMYDNLISVNKRKIEMAKILLNGGFNKSRVENGEDDFLDMAFSENRRGDSSVLKFLIKNFDNVGMKLHGFNVRTHEQVTRFTTILEYSDDITEDLLKEALCEVIEEDGLDKNVPILILRLGVKKNILNDLLEIILYKHSNSKNGLYQEQRMRDVISEDLKKNILLNIKRKALNEIEKHKGESNFVKCNTEIIKLVEKKQKDINVVDKIIPLLVEGNKFKSSCGRGKDKGLQ